HHSFPTRRSSDLNQSFAWSRHGGRSSCKTKDFGPARRGNFDDRHGGRNARIHHLQAQSSWFATQVTSIIQTPSFARLLVSPNLCSPPDWLGSDEGFSRF